MVKIELSNSIKELHLQYCKKHVNLKKNICIEAEELEKINNSEKEYTIENIRCIHNKFIDFCEENLEEIAIGNPNKLKEIISKVKLEYEVINSMIKNNINVSINGKSVKYSDAIF